MAIGVSIVTVLAWFFRLEGRVNTHAQQILDLKDLHAANTKQLRDDVNYIRQRIDQFIVGIGGGV